MFDFPNDLRAHCEVDDESALPELVEGGTDGVLAVGWRVRPGTCLCICSKPQCRRYALFIAIWTGAGMMALVGRYL